MLKQALSNSSGSSSGNKPPLPTSDHSKDSHESGYSQIPWSKYFDIEEKVEIPGTSNVFQVYRSPATKFEEGPVFVLMHGCGLSAMSWALVAGELKKEYNVVAFDFRGHGNSTSDDNYNLSADSLVNDTAQLLGVLFGSESKPPAIVLVGHSMGGAIAARVAASGKVKGVVGLAVVDVVEGTALAALASMQSIIAKRPTSFSSLFKAIEWAVSSETVRSLESARVSIPTQLVQRDDGKWVWRTDLPRTEEHWKGWFTDLSQIFLTARGARLLLLAGTDRLDKTLTVGQMQGKFQLTVLPAVGHIVQEDSPHATASALMNFASRNQFGKPFVFPPKVGAPKQPIS